MLKFNELTFKNFLSTGNKVMKISLGDLGTTLVLGENRDIGEAGYSANGTGKSLIINALFFTLYGKGIDKIKSDAFVNLTNGKNLETSLTFEINGEPYKIVRNRKPNALNFFKGEEDLTLDSMKNTEELIYKTIGMSYSVFLMSFFMAPHKESFMALTGSEQRNIIEELLSLEVLVERADTLKVIKKDIETDKKIVERDIDSDQKRNKETELMIERLKNQYQEFENNRKSVLAELKKLSSELSEVDFEYLSNLCEKMDELSDNVKESERTKTDISKSIMDVDNQISSLERDIRDLEKQKNLAETYHEKKNHFEKAKKEEIDSLVKPQYTIEQVKASKGAIEEYQEISEAIKLAEEEVSDLKRSRESIRSEILSLESGVCSNCGQRHVDEDKLNDLKVNIVSIDAELTSLQETIEEATKEAESIEVLDIDHSEELMKIKSYNDNHERLTKELSDGFPYDPPEDVDFDGEISNTEEEISRLKKTLASFKKDLSGTDKSIEEYNKTIKEIAGELYVYDVNSKAEVDILKKEASELVDQIKDKEDDKNPYSDQLESMSDMIVDIGEHRTRLKELDKDVKHVNYLIKLLTDNKSFIRKNIVDRYVPFLNKKIVEFTRELGLPHICTINSDLSVDIEYMRKSVSYFNMSQGERLRLNIATTGAFRELLSLIGKNTNLVLVDEVLDSALDSGGMNDAFEFLKNSTDNILIISHRDELKSRVDKTITMVKDNGFSFIK